LIGYVQVYKNLLLCIKREYEFCIEELEKKTLRHKEDVDQLVKHEELKLTIKNLKLRKADLEIK
jgi:hypothetical protein